MTKGGAPRGISGSKGDKKKHDFTKLKLLNQTVMPYILMMNENQNNSYIRKKVYKKNPELKHYMYAGQWFLFSIIALIFAFKLLKRNKDE